MDTFFTWVFSEQGLPIVFLILMGVAMLAYTVLDGYDLGVGILMAGQLTDNRDVMIASIGPFWDANETWLVLGVGLLLVAFPTAHGIILGTMYLPVALMLVGLILRGVAFDFRAKARVGQKKMWDHLFFTGSLLATTTQGYMLGQYILGFASTSGAIAFSLISAACVTAAYMLMGASWLIFKTEGELRAFAIKRARLILPIVAVGLVVVSLTNPMLSDRILQRWTTWPDVAWLALLPLGTVLLMSLLWKTLYNLKNQTSTKDYLPFVFTLGIFVCAFVGLAYSFYPYIVPGQLTAWEAASATDSLRIILWGTLFVLPAIAAYTVLSYWIFRGKVRELSYG